MKADLLIKGGTIADGSGGEPFAADIAIVDGRIEAVGASPRWSGAEEIDARGLLVTPGFVDIHTHYDGHATWSDRLEPSSAHGVTTVVMGNCGVGFAPCRPQDRDRLVRLMEGVEDLPGPVLHEGLPWDWESFPDYLDRLEAGRFDMDVAAQVPHAPLRVFVMGERGARREAATAEDIAAMGRLAREAIEAGAIGFSTSRTIAHKSSDGEFIPSLTASADELTGIAREIGKAGRGVIEAISDFDDLDADFDLMRAMSRASGRPLSISLMQREKDPTRWRRVLDRIEAANRDGLAMRGQVCGRPIGLLLGFHLSTNPFQTCPTWRTALADLPLSDRLAALRQPETRRMLIEEAEGADRVRPFEKLYPLVDPVDYEPPASASIAAMAARTGATATACAYDMLMGDDGSGQGILYAPMSNYADGTLDAALEMLKSPNTVLGLGDGGAHCGLICDASFPTWMLTHWGRDRRGERLPIGEIVRALTSDTAEAVAMHDRGRLAAGAKADLNLIDMGRLRLRPPAMRWDLPAGGGRLHQKAYGYVATIVSGAITYREGEATGVLPGRLVRGKRG
ncbi:amidohydrolase [Rhizorhabdus wittichii DC-6]|nr:amidohydrolase [Rhizorhabdus wittichii DC-6]